MSELRSSEPDRIDELLGSLQESRTPHAPAGTPVPPPSSIVEKAESGSCLPSLLQLQRQ